MVGALSQPMIQYRLGLPEEQDLFRLLWLNMIAEMQEETGGDTLPTPRTLDSYCHLYDQYVSGGLKGVALVATADGVLSGGFLAGAAPGPVSFNSSLEPIAMGWGIAVNPEHRRQGIATQLYLKGFDLLRDQGFHHFVGAVHIDNEGSRLLGESVGLEPMQTIVGIDLRARGSR